jgi:hypothetical protein
MIGILAAGIVGGLISGGFEVFNKSGGSNYQLTEEKRK